MKIIKPGKPKTDEGRLTCSCGCIFIYSRQDINPDFRDGPYVICPSCSAWISVQQHGGPGSH